MSRGPALLRRLPRLWRSAGNVWVPVPKEEQAQYPALAADFAFLDKHLLPSFVELDRRAQHEQNRFRRQQLLILLGGAITTVLGATQAALDEAWPGWLVAVTGAALGALTFVARRRDSLSRYLSARLRAEQLRSLYFRYLGHVGEFADEQQRRAALVGAVESLRHGTVGIDLQQRTESA